MAGRDEWGELIASAQAAREQAYAPYSRFPVGAALLSASGKIYTGCNVENAVSGATICAERTALVKAVSEGERIFRALAIVAEVPGGCPPCGICRQVFLEFGKDIVILMANTKGEYVQTTSGELLPLPFTGGWRKERK